MENLKNLASERNLRIAAALATISGLAYSLYVGAKMKKPKESTEKSSTGDKEKKKTSSKGLTKDFWRQLDYILKICVPTLK
jgi:hypothetical protein